MNRSNVVILALAAALVAAPAVMASRQQEPKKVEKKETKSVEHAEEKHESQAGKAATSEAALQKEAKISMEAARHTALKRVPGGKIESGELEREHGKLIYSFDIRTSKPGITEVQVNAITGKIASVTHESPAHEAAEKKKEAKETKH